jgi:hypothetical protein
METIGRERMLPAVMEERMAVHPLQAVKSLVAALGGVVDRKLNEMVCSAYEFTDGDDK